MKICASCGSPAPPYDRQCPNCKAPLNDLTDRLTGTILDDKYLIEHRLGSGGMCDVYRARHMAMDKEIAIKILKPELAADSKIAQRFEQEARAASRVRHPHAIDVTDYGIGAHNVPYLVMQLVDGQLPDNLGSGAVGPADNHGVYEPCVIETEVQSQRLCHENSPARAHMLHVADRAGKDRNRCSSSARISRR